jgi:hypothetical protein
MKNEKEGVVVKSRTRHKITNFLHVDLNVRDLDEELHRFACFFNERENRFDHARNDPLHLLVMDVWAL